MTTVSYNGAHIASVAPGKTATLPCGGLKMKGDVVISVPQEVYTFKETLSATGAKSVAADFDGKTYTADANEVIVGTLISGFYPAFEGQTFYLLPVTDGENIYLYGVLAEQAANGFDLLGDGNATFNGDSWSTVTIEVSSMGAFDAWLRANTQAVEGGECSGRHVIEVDALPTENIDTNALYRCGGKYYEYGLPKLTAIYVYMINSFLDYKTAMIELGLSPENISYNTLPTQTDEGVLESVIGEDASELMFHAYYIIDRDDVYVFVNGEWLSMSDPSIGSGMHYGGVISDISEATDTEAYYVTLGDGTWNEYIPAQSVGTGYNIAYGDTAPEDTTKLWVKTAEPESVEIKLNFDFVGNGELDSGFATFPFKISMSSAAAVGKKIYFFGGNNREDNTALNTVYVFDTVTNTVEASSATLQSAARNIAAAAVGTKIYLFGGAPLTNTIQVFDTVSDTVETLSATLQTATCGLSAVAVGTKIYLFGGYGVSGSTNEYLDTIHIFNTVTNTVETLMTKLPTTLAYSAAAAFGTKIYLFGGNYSISKDTDAIYIFDTETHTVETSSAKLPSALEYLAIASAGTKIYLFGGLDNGIFKDSTCAKIYVFHVETNTVETLSPTLPWLCYSTSAAAVGTDIYIGCVNYNNLIYRFPIAIDLPENRLLIEASVSENIFALLPDMEMGVRNVYLGNADGKAQRVAAALCKDGAWVEI